MLMFEIRIMWQGENSQEFLLEKRENTIKILITLDYWIGYWEVKYVRTWRVDAIKNKKGRNWWEKSEVINRTILIIVSVCVWVSRLVVSNSLQPHGLYPTRALCPWNSPGKTTGVGCHSLLQEIFLTRDQTQVSWISGRFFTIWTTRETLLVNGDYK